MSATVILSYEADSLFFEVGHVESHPIATSARTTGTCTITGIEIGRKAGKLMERALR